MIGYENFLSDIAQKTQELITRNKSYFQEKVNDFISRYNYWKEQLLAGQREALKNKKKLYVGKMPDFKSKSCDFLDIDRTIKESKWEKSIEEKCPKGYILYNPYEIGFSNESDFMVKGIKGYYWGKPLPENPVDTLRIRNDSTIRHPPYTYNSTAQKHIQRKPINENEDLTRKYFLLAVIHANIGDFGIPIINPKNEASQLVWTMYRNMDERKEDVWGNKIQNFITVAMKDVKADLEQRQRETMHTIETRSIKSSQILPVTTEKNAYFDELEKYKTPKDYFMKLDEFKKDPSKCDIVLTNPLFCFMDAIDWECGAIINRLKLALDYIKRKDVGNNHIDDTMIYNVLRETNQQISYLLEKLKKGYWGFRWVLLSELRKVLSSLSSSIFLKISRAPLNYVPEEFEFMEKDLKILNNIHIQHIESKEAFGKRLNKMPFEEAIKVGFEKDALQQIEGDIEQNGDKAAQENSSKSKKTTDNVRTLTTLEKLHYRLIREAQERTKIQRLERIYEEQTKSKIILNTAKRVEELVSDSATMQRWREKMALTFKRPEVSNVKNYDAWQKWLFNLNPATHIDVLYTLLAFCHDDHLRINPIITDALKKQAPSFCEYPSICFYCTRDTPNVLDIFLSYVEKDLAGNKAGSEDLTDTKQNSGKVGEMDKLKESTDDKVKRLREISKSILMRKEIKHSPAFLLEGAGRDVEKALKFGAFNRPEHTILRTQVEQALSQKNVNPYISTWTEIVLWLKYKRPPFLPQDNAKNFPTDCDIVAKAILDEAEAIQEEQSELASSDEARKKLHAEFAPKIIAGSREFRRLLQENENRLAAVSEFVQSVGRDNDNNKVGDRISKPFLTLKSFIEIHCDLTAKPDVQSKVSLLHEYNLKEKIKLPKLAQKYQKGQHKYYYVDDLKKNWPTYQRKMPTLPPLKQPEN